MLYLVGIGLDCDITRKGLAVIKKCHKVYIDTYTSLVPLKEEMGKIVGRDVIFLGRRQMEQESFLLEEAEKGEVAILVAGDPLVATTHVELLLRARKSGIDYEIIHNASIFTAVAETGLQMYRFGKSTSIVFPREHFAPTSFFNTIKENLERNLHTLLFLDVISEDERYMNPSEAIDILVGVGFSGRIVVCSRLGHADSHICHGEIEEFRSLDRHYWGCPPHVIVIPAGLHFMEEEFLEGFGNRI